MKNIFTIIKIASVSLLASILFTACGGGGSDDASFNSGETIISLSGITCTTQTPTASDIAGYVTLYSDDVIVKDEDNTVISIYHDIDGTKKICLVSGDAHIVR